MQIKKSYLELLGSLHYFYLIILKYFIYKKNNNLNLIETSYFVSISNPFLINIINSRKKI